MVAFPIFLFIIAIIVQYALMLNAQVLVRHAAYIAARSAVTSLSENESQDVHTAASIALAPLSPRAFQAPTQEARDISTALANSGIRAVGQFSRRYTYAAAATTVTWDPQGDDFSGEGAGDQNVTVHYQFYLTVPGAAAVISSWSPQPIAGVQGRFLDLRATCALERSPGRNSSGVLQLFSLGD